MPDYQKLYAVLFNSITDAIGQIDAQNYGQARNTLVNAQCEAEDLFISMEDCDTIHAVE